MSNSVAPAERSTSTRRSAASYLTVGELARRTGFTPKTLRYYETIGLLPAPRRRASGYREYDNAYEGRLAFIARAKRLGLSLDEVREILDLSSAGTRPCAHVLGTVASHLTELDETISQLVAFRTELRHLHRDAASRPGGGAVCGIIEHADIQIAPQAARAVDRRRSGGAAIRH